MRVPSALVSFWSRHGADLRHSLRVTIAGVATFAVSHLLQLPQGFWAVLTAVLVVQASLGASLKFAIERLIGTVGGAAYGVAVAMALPHAEPLMRLLTLAVALAPLAFLAATKPSFRVAPVTVVIVLFSAQNHSADIFFYALERVGEICLGSFIGLAASLLIFPLRAHRLVTITTGGTLKIFSSLLPTLLAGAGTDADRVAIEAAHQQIRKVLGKLDTAAQEARQERKGYLTGQADPEPLLRAVRRLRHDLVMIGRALTRPLPESIAPQLMPPLQAVGQEAAAFLQTTGQALEQNAALPPAHYQAAFGAYAAAMAAVRGSGVLRTLPADAVGRVFALAFALEQFQENFAVLRARAEASLTQS